MLIEFEGNRPAIHKNAKVLKGSKIIGKVSIDEESFVLFNCVLRADMDEIKIGKYSNIQDGTVIHTDTNFPTIIKDYVTIGHNCIIHGAKINSNVIVGMGATVLNGVKIPEFVIIGANSLVPQHAELESGWIYVGSPVKKLKPIKEELYERIFYKSAMIYNDLKNKYN